MNIWAACVIQCPDPSGRMLWLGRMAADSRGGAGEGLPDSLCEASAHRIGKTIQVQACVKGCHTGPLFRNVTTRLCWTVARLMQIVVARLT